MRVLITGASGFIGRNLVATLETSYTHIELFSYDHDNTVEDLERFVNKVDFVFHLAGINRPPNVDEFESGNSLLTKRLVSLLLKSARRIPVVFSSSIQADLANPYGISKRHAEEHLLEYAEQSGAEVLIYRLPNVFGKWCRPNYNSVVATFCHNIINDLDITIDNHDTLLTLVYIDDVVSDFIDVLNGNKPTAASRIYHIDKVTEIKLGNLAEKLYSFYASRETLLMPSLNCEFDRALYSTFLSYLPQTDLSYNLKVIKDHRGWLAEFIKSKGFGQIFVSVSKPGVVRGNHWHHTKSEKFLVIKGEAVISFRKYGNSEVIEYRVSGNEPQVIDIPIGYTHSIVNTGDDDLITLFWAAEVFDPNRPDTFPLEV